MEQQVLLDQLYGVDQSRLDDRIRLQGDASLEHQSFWMNFGIWNKETRTLAQASYNLACFLGEHAQLNCEDCVLNVGFGAGDELLVWNRVFNVKRVFGVEAVASQVDLAKSRIMQRSLQDAITVDCGVATNLGFSDRFFSKVLAMDCAYHFHTRLIFFREAFRVLEESGRLAIIDGIFSSQFGVIDRFLNLLYSKYLNIPAENIMPIHQIKTDLARIGYSEIQVHDISSSVIPGFAKFCKSQFFKHPLKFAKYLFTSYFLSFLWNSKRLQIVLITADK